jgi:hypothetical protein
MRIVGITLAKNEEDIIEVFVRYNLCHLDALVISDNSSCDKTRKILTRLIEENLPIVVIDDPAVQRNQSEKTTHLLQSVAEEFQPDWIIPLDADEFLVPEKNQPLADILGSVPGGHVARMPWKSYVPAPSDDQNIINPLKRIRHRREVEDPVWYKVAIPSSIFSDRSLIIDTGNHSVHSSVYGRTYPEIELDMLKLAHYPIRTAEQIVGKAFIGWLANLCDSNRIQGNSFHQEEMFHRFLDNPAPSEEELQQIGLSYSGCNPSCNLIDDPIQTSGDIPIVYTSKSTLLLLKVTRQAEKIALHFAKHVMPLDTLAGRHSGEAEAKGVEDGASESGFRDIPPLRYIHERFTPTSVLVIGDGVRSSLDQFVQLGAHDTQAATIPCILQEKDLGRTFDLVMCMEAMQWISPQDEDCALQTILKHASRVIVFSSMQPGQARTEAPNLKPTEYWVNKFNERGWVVYPFATHAFRITANLLSSRYNAIVLVPASVADDLSSDHPFSVDELLYPPDKSLVWKEQEPGLYEYTLAGDKLAESFAGACSPREPQQRIHELEALLNQQDHLIRQQIIRLDNFEYMNNEQERILTLIQSSRGHRMLQQYYGIRDFILRFLKPVRRFLKR